MSLYEVGLTDPYLSDVSTFDHTHGPTTVTTFKEVGGDAFL